MARWRGRTSEWAGPTSSGRGPRGHGTQLPQHSASCVKTARELHECVCVCERERGCPLCLYKIRSLCRRASKGNWGAHRCLRDACSHCVIALQLRAPLLLFSCKVGAPLWPKASFFHLFSALGHKGMSFFVESPTCVPSCLRPSPLLFFCDSFIPLKR